MMYNNYKFLGKERIGMSELSNIKTLEELFEYWKTKQSNDSGKETCNSELLQMCGKTQKMLSD